MTIRSVIINTASSTTLKKAVPTLASMAFTAVCFTLPITGKTTIRHSAEIANGISQFFAATDDVTQAVLQPERPHLERLTQIVGLSPQDNQGSRPSRTEDTSHAPGSMDELLARTMRPTHRLGDYLDEAGANAHKHRLESIFGYNADLRTEELENGNWRVNSYNGRANICDNVPANTTCQPYRYDQS